MLLPCKFFKFFFLCVEELNCSQEDSQSRNVDNENPVAGSWER
jgi:hypothetical protein